jgi:hypothetical protein
VDTISNEEALRLQQVYITKRGDYRKQNPYGVFSFTEKESEA